MAPTRALSGIAAIAAAAMLTACAAHYEAGGQPGRTGTSHAHQGEMAPLRPAQGTVTGRLVLEGGPLGPGGQQPAIRPISGLVQFIGPNGQTTQVRVDRSGAFAVTLVPGTYLVLGRSPAVVEVSSGGAGDKGTEHPCTSPKTVTLTDQSTVGITLACVVP
ncbi:MAG: hypothetical protein ACTHJW_19260 [Streptosporangiaceae bacterium]